MTADRMGRREGMIHQYVDDVVVLARTPEELQHMINDIVNFKEHNLETNDSLRQERRVRGAAGQAVG